MPAEDVGSEADMSWFKPGAAVARASLVPVQMWKG